MTTNVLLYCWACYANYAEFIEVEPHPNCPDLEALDTPTIYTHFCPKCRMLRSDGSYSDDGEGTATTKEWLLENCTPNIDWMQWVD